MSTTLPHQDHDVHADEPPVFGIDVNDAVYHTAHRYPGGVPALAARMGVNANTLQSQVDPRVGTHHIQLRHALMVQSFSGDLRITHAICAQFGGVFVQCDGQSQPVSTLDSIVSLSREFADLLTGVQQSVSNNSVSQNELLKCEKEAAELMQAVNGTLVMLRSMRRKVGQ